MYVDMVMKFTVYTALAGINKNVTKNVRLS